MSNLVKALYTGYTAVTVGSARTSIRPVSVALSNYNCFSSFLSLFFFLLSAVIARERKRWRHTIACNCIQLHHRARLAATWKPPTLNASERSLKSAEDAREDGFCFYCLFPSFFSFTNLLRFVTVVPSRRSAMRAERLSQIAGNF